MGIIDEELAFLDKNRLGYAMLKEVIEKVVKMKGRASLYIDVFPQVGEKYGKSGLCVERDIRYLLKKGGCKLSSKKFIKSVVEKVLN